MWNLLRAVGLGGSACPVSTRSIPAAASFTAVQGDVLRAFSSWGERGIAGDVPQFIQGAGQLDNASYRSVVGALNKARSAKWSDPVDALREVIDERKVGEAARLVLHQVRSSMFVPRKEEAGGMEGLHGTRRDIANGYMYLLRGVVAHGVNLVNPDAAYSGGALPADKPISLRFVSANSNGTQRFLGYEIVVSPSCGGKSVIEGYHYQQKLCEGEVSDGSTVIVGRSLDYSNNQFVQLLGGVRSSFRPEIEFPESANPVSAAGFAVHRKGEELLLFNRGCFFNVVIDQKGGQKLFHEAATITKPDGAISFAMTRPV